ncbi:MAG: outer membrane lipoprotein carrier protein LolA [candidate division Zixibacteria bacterium]|nr:outer membrane lipoprotein carrier protein LolA [candidate division Zixibacteria bacterium]
MRKKMKTIIFNLLLSLFIVSLSSGITSEELALKIEGKYDSLKTLSVSFQELIKSQDFTTLRKFKGKMYLKNPNKFRIELPSQVVVSDGEFIWVYSKENRQVTKNRVDKSRELFRPNDYLFNFRKNYNYELTGEENIDKKSCYKMVYTSKTEDEFFKKITVFFERETLLAQRIEYLDQNENYTTLSFKVIKPDVVLSDSKFVFNPLPGVELVDLTEIGK